MRFLPLFTVLFALNAQANNKTISAQCEIKTAKQSQALRTLLVENKEQFVKEMGAQINESPLLSKFKEVSFDLSVALAKCLRQDVVNAINADLDSNDAKVQAKAVRIFYTALNRAFSPITDRFDAFKKNTIKAASDDQFSEEFFGSIFNELLAASDVLAKSKSIEDLLNVSLDLFGSIDAEISDEAIQAFITNTKAEGKLVSEKIKMHVLSLPEQEQE